MAKTTVTLLRCDGCKAETGEEIKAKESVAFGYDGYSYTLDLCPSHAESVHATVQSMIGWSSERTRGGAGRRSRRATTSSALKAEPRARSGTTSDRERLRAIRDWARDNGYPELGNRGRIPQHIVDEYKAAHRGQVRTTAQECPGGIVRHFDDDRRLRTVADRHVWGESGQRCDATPAFGPWEKPVLALSADRSRGALRANPLTERTF